MKEKVSNAQISYYAWRLPMSRRCRQILGLAATVAALVGGTTARFASPTALAITLPRAASEDTVPVAEVTTQRQASARLVNTNGEQVGTTTFTEHSTGVLIAVQVNGLPPGEHAIHLHAVGRCDPPDFMSAGGH